MKNKHDPWSLPGNSTMAKPFDWDNEEKYPRLQTPISTVYIQHLGSNHTLLYSLVTKQEYRIKCNECGALSRTLSDEEVKQWNVLRSLV